MTTSSTDKRFNPLQFIIMLASLFYAFGVLMLQGLRMQRERKRIDRTGGNYYTSPLVRMGHDAGMEVWKAFEHGGQCTMTMGRIPPVLSQRGIHVMFLKHPMTLETSVIWIMMYRITYWMIGTLKSEFRVLPFGFGLEAAKQVVYVYRQHKNKKLPPEERARLAEELRALLRQQMREAVEIARHADVPVIFAWFIDSRWDTDRAEEAEAKLHKAIPGIGAWINETLPGNPGGVHDILTTVGMHVTSFHLAALCKDRRDASNGWLAVSSMFRTNYGCAIVDVTDEVRALAPDGHDVTKVSLERVTDWLNQSVSPRMAQMLIAWRQKRELP